MVAGFYAETNSKINKLARKQPLHNRCSGFVFSRFPLAATVAVGIVSGTSAR
jgi:hypothetical protein